MALELLTIASSSKGNCILIRNGSHNLLIDMGINLCHLLKALDYYKISPEDINGVIITHEHIDHVRGLDTLVRRYRTPVFSHKLTMNEIEKKYKLSLPSYDVSETGFSIGNIDVQPFRTRHDAIYSLGYSLSDRTGRIAVATDLGSMTKGVINNLKGSNIVFIESNHDLTMLKNGAYPEFLKQRIRGPVGHLSNDDCSSAVLELASSGTDSFILGHLSENNNTARIAYRTTAERLMRSGYSVGDEIALDVAAPNSVYNSYSVSSEIRRKSII
jgi:phosphoribosyl 1,2-cyclic phosphodiesterase